MNEQIEIKLNKKRKIIVLVGLIFFAPLTIWGFVAFLLPLLPGFYKFKIVVIAVLGGLFGFVIFLLFKQACSKKPALVINDQGIIENSLYSGGVGLIP